jgi:hypothetical protein
VSILPNYFFCAWKSREDAGDTLTARGCGYDVLTAQHTVAADRPQREWGGHL